MVLFTSIFFPNWSLVAFAIINRFSIADIGVLDVTERNVTYAGYIRFIVTKAKDPTFIEYTWSFSINLPIPFFLFSPPLLFLL